MADMKITKDSNMIKLLSAQARGERVGDEAAKELDKEIIR